MYTYYPNRGVVIRDSDGVQVAPAESAENPNFLEYNAWANAGNHPTVGVEPVITSRVVSKLEFRRRFTLAERVAVDSATDATVNTLRIDLATAEEINLDDADVVAGLAYLEQLELIAGGRAAEIRG